MRRLGGTPQPHLTTALRYAHLDQGHRPSEGSPTDSHAAFDGASLSCDLGQKRLHKASDPSSAIKNVTPTKTLLSVSDQAPALANKGVSIKPTGTVTTVKITLERTGNTINTMTTLAIPYPFIGPHAESSTRSARVGASSLASFVLPNVHGERPAALGRSAVPCCWTARRHGTVHT